MWAFKNEETRWHEQLQYTAQTGNQRTKTHFMPTAQMEITFLLHSYPEDFLKNHLNTSHNREWRTWCSSQKSHNHVLRQECWLPFPCQFNPIHDFLWFLCCDLEFEKCLHIDNHLKPLQFQIMWWSGKVAFRYNTLSKFKCNWSINEQNGYSVKLGDEHHCTKRVW